MSVAASGNVFNGGPGIDIDLSWVAFEECSFAESWAQSEPADGQADRCAVSGVLQPVEVRLA